MEKNAVSEKMDWKVPESIVEYYAPYTNQTDTLKVTEINKTKFEIHEKYEILDIGTFC